MIKTLKKILNKFIKIKDHFLLTMNINQNKKK